MNRRDFLKATAAAGIVAGLPAASHAAANPVYKTKLEKALIAQVADDATCEQIAKAGFPGMNSRARHHGRTSHRRTAHCGKARAAHPLADERRKCDFNNPDPDARKRR